MDIIKDIQGIDMVITSPPYAEQRKSTYGGVSSSEYKEWFTGVSNLVYSSLKDDGSFFFNIKEHVKEGTRETYVLETLLAQIKSGWNWVDEFIWNKTNPFPTGNKKRLKDAWERIYQLTKTKDYKFFPENVMYKSEAEFLEKEKTRHGTQRGAPKNGSGMMMSQRLANDFVRPSNVLTLSTNNSHSEHPAVFPEGLPEFFIKLTTNKDDIVLDPFGGSGTTGAVAIRNNRKFILIDKEEKYCEMSAKRCSFELSNRSLDIHGFL